MVKLWVTVKSKEAWCVAVHGFTELGPTEQLKNNTIKGLSIVNKAEIDVFWNSLAFSIIQQMLTI